MTPGGRVPDGRALVETLDRDAGCFEAKGQGCSREDGPWYWDETNKTSPNFAEHLGWAATISENTGMPLLEQAEDAGLLPDHGCRMGICNTCSCRKRCGTVRNLLTGETSATENELIRICVSVPVGDVEIAL